MHILPEDWNFTFGKYKGQSLYSIIRNDPDYLLWCIINIEIFVIPITAFKAKQILTHPQFTVAFNRNLIKWKIIADLLPNLIEEYLSSNNQWDDYNETSTSSDMQGDWGGLYGEEAHTGYWNTE